MISPMIEDSGARTGAAIASGSAGADDDSFSVTVWRAR